MASEDSDSAGSGEKSHEPRECMACRGTGRVISNLGGTRSEVSCPWCAGTGQRVPGIDAQEHFREAAGDEESADAEPAAAPPDAS